ncbi:hypothetical protein ACX9I7_32405 [Streptomyces sp. L500]
MSGHHPHGLREYGFAVTARPISFPNPSASVCGPAPNAFAPGPTNTTAIVTLKATIANKNAEITRLKDDVKGFLAENTRLTLENQELRDVLSGPTANVTPLRPGPSQGSP